MLSTLRIDNIAVIEHAEIEFGQGLNVLTGETGAGKSIIIDSLGAVIGARTSRDLVRSGAQSAMISAVFENISGETSAILAENDIDCEDGQLIAVRKLSADGKNSCRINGFPVTVAQLRSIGAGLIDIHGQNEGQRLLDESSHLAYLDGFARLGAELEEYAGLYGLYREAQNELKALEMSEEEKQYKTELLRRHIAELEAANLTPGEEEPLLSRSSVLRNAEKLISFIDGAYESMYGGEDSGGAVSLIADAAILVKDAARLNDEFSELADAVSDLKFAADDIAERLRDARASLDFTPGELDEIESRLSLLQRLQKKYRRDIGGLIELLDTSGKELESIEYAEDRAKQLERELDARYTAAYNAAKALSAKRKLAAELMAEKIRSELKQLSMPSVRFKVDFEEKPVGPSGIDEVRFLMSANAGETLGRISRIASGGELSRIMLAMKNVIAEHDTVGTMVFDEVDSGVSGIAAQRVGEKLSDLARSRQVLCVTHLPQLAAMADRQYIIEKTSHDDRTYTTVSLLSESGREAELSRLTGGENITETTISSAREQLSAARAYKERKKHDDSI